MLDEIRSVLRPVVIIILRAAKSHGNGYPYVVGIHNSIG
jgi:hypothetical protein